MAEFLNIIGTGGDQSESESKNSNCQSNPNSTHIRLSESIKGVIPLMLIIEFKMLIVVCQMQKSKLHKLRDFCYYEYRIINVFLWKQTKTGQKSLH